MFAEKLNSNGVKNMRDFPDISNDLIVINDPELNPAQIMDQIRTRIRLRREELGYPRQEFPTFMADYPGEPEGEAYDVDLYHHLRLANRSYYQLGIEMVLVPSSRSRIPLIGKLWDWLRYEAHSLVLFYVNKLAQRQVTVNRYLVSTLNRIVVHLQEQQRQIRSLENEVKVLRGQSQCE